MRKNMRFLVIVFVAIFAAMIFYLVYAVSLYGERWFATPNNPRIANVRVAAGSIQDRTGRRLAWTEGEERKYATDSSLRKSVSHVVGDTYGMTRGAESFFARYLYGFEEDAVGRITDVLQGNRRQGADIRLTVDAALSDYALHAMGSRDGAVVLLDYGTGEVLAAVSSPGFDPGKIKSSKAKTASSALFNRAFMGRYPPGSLFKVVTASAVLEDPQAELEGHDCTGEVELDGEIIPCAGNTAHGEVDLESAFIHSCNTFFAEQSVRLGADRLYAQAVKFGFNDDFLFDDMIVYKSEFNRPSAVVDTAWAGIGQYEDLMTPLHAAMIAGCVANKGVMMEPRLLRSATSPDGAALYAVRPKTYRQPVSEAVADTLKDMMESAVKKGTGTRAAVKGLDIGGKTGTAQYTDTKGKKREHAWFIGFIGEKAHPLAIAVLLEGAGSGGRYAAPVAAKVFKKAVDLGY